VNFYQQFIETLNKEESGKKILDVLIPDTDSFEAEEVIGIVSDRTSRNSLEWR